MNAIDHSVGQYGTNDKGDVRVIQRLLNDDLERRGKQLLTVDGLVGPKTIGAITDYQKHHKLPFVDGRVDANGLTLENMVKQAMYGILAGFTPLNKIQGVFLNPMGGQKIDHHSLKRYIRKLRVY